MSELIKMQWSILFYMQDVHRTVHVYSSTLCLHVAGTMHSVLIKEGVLISGVNTFLYTAG